MSDEPRKDDLRELAELEERRALLEEEASDFCAAVDELVGRADSDYARLVKEVGYPRAVKKAHLMRDAQRAGGGILFALDEMRDVLDKVEERLRGG
jgi:hypothetical protein